MEVKNKQYVAIATCDCEVQVLQRDVWALCLENVPSCCIHGNWFIKLGQGQGVPWVHHIQNLGTAWNKEQLCKYLIYHNLQHGFNVAHINDYYRSLTAVQWQCNYLQWNLWYKATTMRDHLQWKTTLNDPKSIIFIHFHLWWETTCHLRPQLFVP